MEEKKSNKMLNKRLEEVYEMPEYVIRVNAIMIEALPHIK